MYVCLLGGAGLMCEKKRSALLEGGLLKRCPARECRGRAALCALFSPRNVGESLGVAWGRFAQPV